MAEFIMKDKVNKLGLSDNYLIESRATSYEEDGNDIYPLAKNMLEEKNIPFTKHRSTRLEKSDLEKFDYFIVGLVGRDPAVGSRGRIHPVRA